MKTQTHYSCLVGNRFRLSGSLVLPVLSEGTKLLLEAEPDNKYDPDAVKVMVDMTGHQFVPRGVDSGPIIWLGYLPMSGTKTDKTGFGNKEALQIMNGYMDWKCTLTFDPMGEPLVRIDIV